MPAASAGDLSGQVGSVLSGGCLNRTYLTIPRGCRLGDFGAAAALHYELLPLMHAMFIENNPTAVKTAAAMLGLCSEELRLPLTALSPENRARVAEAVASSAMLPA